MKTRLRKMVIAGIVAGGIILPAGAWAADKESDSTAGVDARFLSDKPVEKILFHHTDAKPYDIKCQSWYGGVMQRIVAENRSNKPITVSFAITHLPHGIVAVPARDNSVTKLCEPGKTTELMDVMSKDGGRALAYNFSHHAKAADVVAVR